MEQLDYQQSFEKHIRLKILTFIFRQTELRLNGGSIETGLQTDKTIDLPDCIIDSALVSPKIFSRW